LRSRIFSPDRNPRAICDCLPQGGAIASRHGSNCNAIADRKIGIHNGGRHATLAA
jgi:hypothetical protein